MRMWLVFAPCRWTDWRESVAVGVGLAKDFKTVTMRMVLVIAAGWVLTPSSAVVAAYGLRWGLEVG